MNIIERMEKGFTALQNCIDRPDAEGEMYELLSLAKQGQQMRWVPIGERLPENKKKCWPTVVLCTNGKSIYKAILVMRAMANMMKQRIAIIGLKVGTNVAVKTKTSIGY